MLLVIKPFFLVVAPSSLCLVPDSDISCGAVPSLAAEVLPESLIAGLEVAANAAVGVISASAKTEAMMIFFN